MLLVVCVRGRPRGSHQLGPPHDTAAQPEPENGGCRTRGNVETLDIQCAHREEATVLFVARRRLGCSFFRATRMDAPHFRATSGKPDEEMAIEFIHSLTFGVSGR